MSYKIYDYESILRSNPCNYFEKDVTNKYYSDDIFHRLNQILEDMNNDNKRVNIVSKDFELNKINSILNKLNDKNYDILLEEIINFNIENHQKLVDTLYRTALNSKAFVHIYCDLIFDIITKKWMNVYKLFIDKCKNDFDNESDEYFKNNLKTYPIVLAYLCNRDMISKETMNMCINKLIESNSDVQFEMCILILMNLRSNELVKLYFNDLNVNKFAKINRLRYMILDLKEKHRLIIKETKQTKNSKKKDKSPNKIPVKPKNELSNPQPKSHEINWELKVNSIIKEYYKNYSVQFESLNTINHDLVNELSKNNEKSIMVENIIINTFEYKEHLDSIKNIFSLLVKHKVLTIDNLKEGVLGITNILSDLAIDFPNCINTFRDLMKYFLINKMIDKEFFNSI